MSLANNDYNWRLVAAEALLENDCVTIDAAGKAAKADAADQGRVVGIVPQAIAAGERAPIIRGGKIGGLVGKSAGQKLRAQSDATLGTAGTFPVIAVVVSEDAATAVILSGALDQGV